MFLAGYAIIDGPLVEHLCQRVYFPAKPASIGHVTSVNGILYILLRERIVYEFCSTLGTDSYNSDRLTDTLELKLRWIHKGDPILRCLQGALFGKDFTTRAKAT